MGVTGLLLEEIRHQELARMTDEAALRVSEFVLSFFDADVARELRTSSGLIAQQELFRRLGKR